MAADNTNLIIFCWRIFKFGVGSSSALCSSAHVPSTPESANLGQWRSSSRREIVIYQSINEELHRIEIRNPVREVGEISVSCVFL